MQRFLHGAFLCGVLAFAPYDAGAAEAPQGSQFSKHLKGVKAPVKNFDDFARQLQEVGMRMEGDLNSHSFEATVPRGRSLQKDTVRQLRALTYKVGSTFLGYAPATDKGEVISWNEFEGRYDFLQFTGLKRNKLSVTEANRAFCTSCHLGGIPIFPRAPWTEMFEEATFKKYKVVDEDLDKLSVKEREKKRFFNVSFFDKAVRMAKSKLQRENTCRDMCGSDVACRAQLLLASLLFRDVDARRSEMEQLFDVIQKGAPPVSPTGLNSVEKRNLEKLARFLESSWPANRFAITSSTLLDRSAVTNAGFKLVGKLRNGEEASYSDGFSHVSVGRSPVVGEIIRDDISRYQQAEFTNDTLREEVVVKNDVLLQPKNMRPETDAIPKAIAGRWARAVAFDCFSTSDVWSSLAATSPEVLENAVKSKNVQAALCTWPASIVKTASALESSIEAIKKGKRLESGSVACGAGETGEGGPAQVAATETESSIALSLLPAKGAFQKYCTECHGPGTDIPLKLDSIDFLKSYRGVYEHSVRSTLESRAMPPKTALQPTDEERRTMLNELSR